MLLKNKKEAYNTLNFAGTVFNTQCTVRQLGKLFNSNAASAMGADNMFKLLFGQIEKKDEIRSIQSFRDGYTYASQFQALQISNLTEELAEKGSRTYFKPVPEWVQRFKMWKVNIPTLSKEDHVTHLCIKSKGWADHEIDAPSQIDYFYEVVFTHMVLLEKKGKLHILECYQIIHGRGEEEIKLILI